MFNPSKENSSIGSHPEPKKQPFHPQTLFIYLFIIIVRTLVSILCEAARKQGRIKLFGAPRQWKHFHLLFQAVFLSGEGVLPPRLSQTPRLPVPRQK